MKRDQILYIQVADAIAVGQAESLVAQMVANALQPAARHRRFACVNQRDLPRFHTVVQEAHLPFAHLEGHVAHVQHVAREVFFDEMTLVPAANDEIIYAMMRVQLHDVPQDRSSADLDHGLRLDLRFLAQPRAKTASEYDCLHIGPFLPQRTLMEERASARLLLCAGVSAGAEVLRGRWSKLATKRRGFPNGQGQMHCHVSHFISISYRL